MSSAKTASLLFALVAVLASAVVRPGLAHAEILCDPSEETEYACTFEIEDPGIQRVPGLLKFQARISQAKLPVGDAVLNQVTVNLVNLQGTQCTEKFSGVRVRNSVLNLEIGHYIDCPLDDVIAREDGLSFQVCIGGGCLKPIALGTVPYAIKANFAVQAQEAHTADVAAQAHYAHRVTADRNLFAKNAIGAGYFDFHTHPTAGKLYADEEYVPYREGGFIQWAPVNQPDGPTLNICSKDLLTDEPTPLSELVLYAVDTTTRGNAMVEGDLHVFGKGTVDTGLTVTGGGSIAGGLTVTEGSTLNQGVVITDTALSGADLICQGDTQVLGHTYLDGGATIEMGATVNGGLTVSDSATSGHDLICGGSAKIDGGATVANGLTLTGGADVTGDIKVAGSGTIDGGLAVTQGSGSSGLTVTGDSAVNGKLGVTDELTAGSLDCAGFASFAGGSTFGSAESISGTSMQVYADATFHGAVTMAQGMSGDTLNFTTYRLSGVYHSDRVHSFGVKNMCVIGYKSDNNDCWFERDKGGTWTLHLTPWDNNTTTCEGICL
jgi:hypothetical protein